MLFKLSLKNIKKSIKDYTIYFLTLFLSVAVFYIFNSIEDQQAFIVMTSEEHGMFTSMWVPIIKTVSIAVSIVLGILIVYANMFLIKRRKKEFGIYMLLGMSKLKISAVIMLETIFVAIISLAAGLALGVFVSQPLTVLIAKLFESNIDRFIFTFSQKSFIQTCIYFSIMYMVVLIASAIVVSGYRLINLLNSAKKSERIRVKNPVICVIVFLIGAAVLGYAYWLVTGNFYNINDFNTVLNAIILGVISTFLIFWSLSGLILKITKSSKKFYLRGMNIFVLRQIDSKINTTVVGMTIICLMLFVTISVLSVSIALRNAMIYEMKKFIPVDIYMEALCDNYIFLDDGRVENIDNPEEFKNLKISEELFSSGLRRDIFRDVADIRVYCDTNFTGGKLFKDVKDKIYDEVSEDLQIGELYYQYTEFDKSFVYIMKQSNYNRLAEMYNLDKVNLKSDEYSFVCNFKDMRTLGDIALSKGNRITVMSKTYKPKYNRTINGFRYIPNNETEDGFVVLPDDCGITEDNLTYSFMVANYNSDDKIEKEQMKNEFEKYRQKFAQKYQGEDHSIYEYVYFKSDIVNRSHVASTIIAFVSIYLSIIFLITSAAILSLKQLTESSDNKERYSILRKLGCDEKMINKALFRQIAVFFIMPLLLAVVHSVFGITFATLVLINAYKFSDLIVSIIAVAVIIIMVYGAYFIATYICSKNIIKGK